MQATVAQPPEGAQVPATAGTPITAAPSAAIQLGIPRTESDLAALKSRREELSNQLVSASGRRQRLSTELRGKDGVDRAGLESHMAVLDKRIMQLESDIALTGQQLTLTPGYLVASTEGAKPFNGMDPDAVAALTALFFVVVLMPMAIAFARRIWKRTSSEATAPALPGDATRRLERLEQGVDAIAIEIERVSEGQRFVTRLLSDAHNNPALAVPRIGGEIEPKEKTRQAGT